MTPRLAVEFCHLEDLTVCAGCEIRPGAFAQHLFRKSENFKAFRYYSDWPFAAWK